MYAIKNKDDDQLFWSNALGWVESPDETLFSQEERDTLNLPIGGVWVYVGEPTN
jgi:hypothetical protein